MVSYPLKEHRADANTYLVIIPLYFGIHKYRPTSPSPSRSPGSALCGTKMTDIAQPRKYALKHQSGYKEEESMTQPCRGRFK